MTENPLMQYEEPLRGAYLVVLASVATADHENSQGELAFMQQMAGVAGLSAGSVQAVEQAMRQPQAVNYGHYLSQLQQSDLKYALLADIVNMLYADGDMDGQELAQVARINAALGISDEQFRVVQDYVKKANSHAEAQEGTPGLMGLMGGGSEGTGMDLGSLMGMASDFLSKSGMSSQFQQAGIPANNFQSGSTIGTVLTGITSAILQSQMGGQSQGGQTGGGMGDMLGGLVGSMFGGEQQQPTTQSRGMGAAPSGQDTGWGGMVASVLGSPQGQAMVKGLIGQVMGSNQQGKGLSNMSSMLGGGQAKQQGNMMGGIMDMLLK